MPCMKVHGNDIGAVVANQVNERQVIDNAEASTTVDVNHNRIISPSIGKKGFLWRPPLRCVVPAAVRCPCNHVLRHVVCQRMAAEKEEQ